MSSVHLQVEDASLVEWREVSFSVSSLPYDTIIDTTDADVEIFVHLNSNKEWSSNYSQSVWIKVATAFGVTQNVVTWDSTNPYTYKITIPQGTNVTILNPWCIHIQATIPKCTKLKALSQKITSKFLDFEKIGMAAEIHGKNSAGTGDCSLAKQTYKNPLAGQCEGLFYGVDGTPTTASTSTQQNDLYVITPSTGKIKILEAGHYLVIASVYGYSGFTAEDRLDFRIQVNGSNVSRFFARERMSGIYQIIYMVRTYRAEANDELNIAVTNYEAARGIVVTSLPTTLQVMRLK